VGGGCHCALDLNLNMFKWVIHWFVVWLNVVGLDFLAVEFKLKVVGINMKQVADGCWCCGGRGGGGGRGRTVLC
jgi:hypothetical protein